MKISQNKSLKEPLSEAMQIFFFNFKQMPGEINKKISEEVFKGTLARIL